jgi:hypothetical protein
MQWVAAMVRLLRARVIDTSSLLIGCGCIQAAMRDLELNLELYSALLYLPFHNTQTCVCDTLALTSVTLAKPFIDQCGCIVLGVSSQRTHIAHEPDQHISVLKAQGRSSLQKPCNTMCTCNQLSIPPCSRASTLLCRIPTSSSSLLPPPLIAFITSQMLSRLKACAF